MLSRLAAAGLIGALALAALGAGPAAADGTVTCGSVGLDGSRDCEVAATEPGGTGGSAQNVGSTSPAKVTCEWKGQEVDCTSDEGTWSNARQCWVQMADPQPVADSSLWEGHTDGAIYKCSPPSGGGGLLGVAWGGITYFWSDAAPVAVNPSALAREAVERMNLRSPRVGATPLPSSDAVSVIGLPTWLWVDNADERGWGPITRSASAGGVTVTATARVSKVVWDMGDGNRVTCRNAGTEWTPAKGDGDSPTCGYRYETPGMHTITATTFWRVGWSGAGQSGTITFDMAGSRSLDVVELRAVVTG